MLHSKSSISLPCPRDRPVKVQIQTQTSPGAPQILLMKTKEVRTMFSACPPEPHTYTHADILIYTHLIALESVHIGKHYWHTGTLKHWWATDLGCFFFSTYIFTQIITYNYLNILLKQSERVAFCLVFQLLWCKWTTWRLHALFQNPDFLCENVRRGFMSAYFPINHLGAPACLYIVYGLPSPRTMYCNVVFDNEHLLFRNPLENYSSPAHTPVIHFLLSRVLWRGGSAGRKGVNSYHPLNVTSFSVDLWEGKPSGPSLYHPGFKPISGPELEQLVAFITEHY